MESKQAELKPLNPSATASALYTQSAVVAVTFLAAVACFAAAVSIVGALYTRLMVAIAAIPLLLIVAYGIYRRPIWVLYIFILFLPLHFLLLVILYAQFGLPSSFMRIVASWKEVLLFGTLAIVACSVLAKRRVPSFTWIDGVALTWLLLILLYALFHDLFFNWQSDMMVRLYGIRDWLLYLVPYFIGRLVPVTEKQTRTILKLILVSGTIMSVVGLIDYFFVPVSAHLSLGVARYYNEIYSQFWNTELPYWTFIPGLGNTRRLTSFMFSGQNFALTFLVFLPVAVYNYRARLTRWYRMILLVAVTSLLLSITRATIAVCAVQSIIVLWMTGAKRLVLNTAYALTVLLVIVLVASPDLRTYVLETITFTEASAATRPQQWRDGLAAAIDMPFGYGIGSTGLISGRMGVEVAPVEGSETAYLKITGALGFPGLILWLTWFLGIVLASYHTVRRQHGIKRGVAIIAVAMSVGFILNNFTAPPDQSLFVIYVFPWIAGIVVRWATQSRTISPHLPATSLNPSAPSSQVERF
jgi:O-antigen ligase